MEKFLKKIKKLENNCWEWVGATTALGYGSFCHDGKTLRAHRAAWEIYKGKIPEKMCVCHACDNPKCVNPEHLFLGTHKFNTEDMIKKNRGFWQKEEKVKHRFASKREGYEPHPLEKYFLDNDIAIGKAAKRIGICIPHLHRILRRTHFPSVGLAYKIEDYTHGKISWETLVKPKSIPIPTPEPDDEEEGGKAA